MWIEDVGPEQFAEFFHHYHRALEVFCKPSETGSSKKTPLAEENRLVAVAHLMLLGQNCAKKESAKARPYFAEPGEADWGC